MDVINVIRAILESNEEINSLQIKEFPSRQILQERLTLSGAEMENIKQALRIREDLRLPFWDCLISQYLQDEIYSTRLLSEALFHNSFCSCINISSNELENISNLILQNSARQFAISSSVTLKNGKVKHIPMLDFHIPMRSSFPSVIQDILNLLGEGDGFILESGESYHYYGTRLLDEKQMLIFLAKALRMSPIIDRAWISHQIEEGACALRIGAKKGFYPHIVKTLQDTLQI